MSLYKDRTAPTALFFDRKNTKTPEYAVLSGDGLVVVHRCFVRKERTLLHYNTGIIPDDTDQHVKVDLEDGTQVKFGVALTAEAKVQNFTGSL